MTAILAKETGQRMREIRKSKHMSIVELAKKVGVSKSLISQVERGEVLPSLSTLNKVANSLGVEITEFFRIDQPRMAEEDIVVRKDNRKKITIPNSSMVYYLLTPNLQQNVEFLIIDIPPFTDAGNNEIDTFKHDGEEYFLVLEGQLLLCIEEHEYVLNAGDSGCFDSSQGHVWKNTTDKKGSFLIAATAPMFKNIGTTKSTIL